MGLEDSQFSDASSSLGSALVARWNQVVMLFGIQVVLVLCVCVVCLVTLGWFEVLAAMYGGVMAIAGAWMLTIRIRLAKKIAQDMPGRELRVLYVGAIQRFVLMLILFVIGMVILKLDPGSLLSGFVVSLGGGVLGSYLHTLYFSDR